MEGEEVCAQGSMSALSVASKRVQDWSGSRVGSRGLSSLST